MEWPSWSSHKPSRAAAEWLSLVETSVDVGVMMEGSRGKGAPLPIGDTPLNAPVDGVECWYMEDMARDPLGVVPDWCAVM